MIEVIADALLNGKAMNDVKLTGKQAEPSVEGKEVKTIAATIAVSALVVIYASLYAASSANRQENSFQKDASENALFIKNCASCHGKDGRAKTFKAKFNHARDLTNPNWQAAMSDEHIYNSILKGKGKMPAFDRKLSDNEIAALVTYVRMLKR
jgi:mono/diheme cytochrome c family protein